MSKSSAVEYTAREYGNMMMCLGEAQGNCSLALRLYREKFPSARHPTNPRIMTTAFQRLIENRPIAPSPSDGRIEFENSVETKSRKRKLSSRNGATAKKQDGTNVFRSSKNFIWRKSPTTKEYPNSRRHAYCRWLLQTHKSDPEFIQHVMWTNMATFTKKGLQGPKEPKSGYWTVNVWAGILNGRILGPIFLSSQVDRPRYMKFINDDITEILDDLSVSEHEKTWYHNTNLPGLSINEVPGRLNELFKDRWIGESGPIDWPPQSSDLSPVNFFLWSYVNDRIIKEDCKTASLMKTKIVEFVNQLREACEQDPTIMTKMYKELMKRVRNCNKDEGDIPDCIDSYW